MLALTDGTPLPTPTPGLPSPSPVPSIPGDVTDEAQKSLSAQLEKGYIAFNPVREMRVGEKERVEVHIRRAFAEALTDDVKRKLSEGISQKGKVEFDTLEVGENMIVRLAETDDFAITAFTKERQALVEGRITKWKWDVTPLRAGRHSLVLCVDVELIQQGRDKIPVSDCRFERQIDVSVNPVATATTFVGNHWEWLLGGPLGTAALAWLTRQAWFKRKQSDE